MDLLLEQILPMVTAICRHLAGDATEDAAQEALLAVFRRLGTLEQPEALTAWVATTARREALRQARKPIVASLPDDACTPQTPKMIELHDALATLPLPQREVLILRDLVGLSERETADLLTLACGTVKSRLHRARATFRKAWLR